MKNIIKEFFKNNQAELFDEPQEFTEEVPEESITYEWNGEKLNEIK